MKTLLVSLLLFQVSILFHAQLLEAKTCFLTQKFQIRIVDNLPPGNSKFTLCCKSKDDYIGGFILEQNEETSWTFCENVLQRTLYFCNFFWGDKVKRLEVFNRDLGDRCKSNVCLWSARSDGIYFTGDNNPASLRKELDWDDKRSVNLTCQGF